MDSTWNGSRIGLRSWRSPILEYARHATRILVTRDKDFGELIFKNEMPHCGVLRLGHFALVIGSA